MQLVQCDVFLAGDRNHMVRRTGVTVPELAVLRQIHGGDGVGNIKPTGMDKRAHGQELERLKGIYDRREQIVARLFPGASPKLPAKLADLGLDDDGEDEDKPKSNGRKRKRNARSADSGKDADDADDAADGDGDDAEAASGGEPADSGEPARAHEVL